MTDINFIDSLSEEDKNKTVTYGQLAVLIDAMYKNLVESFENVEKEIEPTAIAVEFIKAYLDIRYPDFRIKFERFLKSLQEEHLE